MFKKKEKNNTARSHGITLKKQYGQHFLRDASVIERMLEAVTLTQESSVFEIGCGDGFLTDAIMARNIARLWVFEIDPDWAQLIKKRYAHDARLTMHLENILDVDFSLFEQQKPWTLLANLPYQITFPFLHMLQKRRAMLKEAVVMVQEEVALKLTKKSGRGYGFPSLFFQYYFEVSLILKIKPSAFFPPPKVNSALVYLQPNYNNPPIADEENFWKFIKLCFAQPRRTLRNNLGSTHYVFTHIAPEILARRAQEMDFIQLLALWNQLRG